LPTNGRDTVAMQDMPGMVMPGTRRTNGTTGDATSGTAGVTPGGEKPATGTANEISLTAAQIRTGQIHWEAVVMGTTQGTTSVPGQVVPNEDHTARLGSPASGRVLSIRVSPGDRVNRDEVLVTLSSPAASMAQADVAKATAAEAAARAQAAYATSARERSERLLALKAIPRQDYEKSIADDALAQSMLGQATAELARARSTAAQLGSGSGVAGEIAVRSPFAGVVLLRSAAPGAVVESGAPLVVVTDPSMLWLTMDAPESMVNAFHRGDVLQFHVPSFPGETFSARIDAIGPGLDPRTRTLPVRAIIANSGSSTNDRRLRPDMLAMVTARTDARMSAIVLPDDAVQLWNGQSVVFLVTTDSAGGAKFVARLVEAGARSGGRIAVLRGIVAGDVVVTAGAFRVKSQLQNSSMRDMAM